MPYRPAQVWTGSTWDDVGDKRVGVPEINTQTANYTLALTDIAKRVEMNSTSARTITIPLNSSVAFPVGSRIDIANINTGALTVAATSGATVNGRSLVLGQWETATLVQRAANTWVLEPQAGLTAALASKSDVAGETYTGTHDFSGATLNTTFTDAWTSWTPTITAVSGTITTSSITSAAYQEIGKIVICRFDVSISNAGTGSGALRLTLPVSAKNISNFGGSGREYSITGNSLTVGIDSGTLTAMEIRRYDNQSIIVNNYRIIGQFIYEAA